MSVRPVWEEKPSVLGQLGKGTILTLVTGAVLVPLWVVLVTSLSSSKTINNAGGYVVIPREFDPSAYVVIFSGGLIGRAVWVSVLITALGTSISLALTVLAAYGSPAPTRSGTGRCSSTSCSPSSSIRA